MERIYILVMLIMLMWIAACGWNKTPKTPSVQPLPPIAFQPTCAGLPAGYKMDLLRLSKRLSQEGREVVIGSCQGECGFLVYVDKQDGTTPVSHVSEASDSELAQQLSAAVEGKPVCVEEGTPPPT
jgi:hypothetical protein